MVMTKRVAKREQEDTPRIDLKAEDPLATVNRSATARALRINVSNVSRILSGQRIPHVKTLWKMANYFGMTLDELFLLLGLDKR